jgi:hypothetical protein
MKPLFKFALKREHLVSIKLFSFIAIAAISPLAVAVLNSFPLSLTFSTLKPLYKM